MNRIVFVLAVLALVAAVGVPSASAGAGNGYAHDFNWLRDADGDGIPNGLDEDWIRPLDGSGYQLKHGFGSLSDGLFLTGSEDGKTHRNQYRHRKNQAENGGDCIRNQQQLRDGSCK